MKYSIPFLFLIPFSLMLHSPTAHAAHYELGTAFSMTFYPGLHAVDLLRTWTGKCS
jgi:hypothetical protein